MSGWSRRSSAWGRSSRTSSRRRGGSGCSTRYGEPTMIKKVISLVVFLLLANAGIRVGMVYFHDQQFKDALNELSLFSGNKSEEIVRAKVMELAAQNQIPLDP